MTERNAGLPVHRRQSFRIGLHLGDIIHSDRRVRRPGPRGGAPGNAGEPGSIVPSGSVYEQVRDKLRSPFRAQGARTLKNIDRPLRVYRPDAAALSPATPPPRKRIPRSPSGRRGLATRSRWRSSRARPS